MDIKHFYIERGTGKPLILLHGNGESCEYFMHQIEEFSSDYRVIAPDTRGHGRTPRGTAPFTIRQFAEDLYAFMQDMGIEKADILGFSDGANIAAIFALRHPECVDRLILNGANLNPGGVKLTAQLPIEIGYRMARLFSRRSAAAAARAEMLGLMVNDPDIRPEELRQIRHKTLVIAGSNDMIRTGHSRLIARLIPNAEFCMMEGDHFIANKKPSAFNGAVRDFLTRT